LVPASTPAPTPPPGTGAELWDDFDYASPGDADLVGHGWRPRSASGGPGPAGATYATENVSFVRDASAGGNTLLRLTATTRGKAADTRQAQLSFDTPKFLDGTYAARVLFNDAPAEGGPDGDQVVATFFTITPYRFCNDPGYAELDFEYLANGGWGVAGATLWMTSWESYCDSPWSSDNSATSHAASLQGWHTLVLQADYASSTTRYFVDGEPRATHGPAFYPDAPMTLAFNLWFIEAGLRGEGTRRMYQQDVDWVYYLRNTLLADAVVHARVEELRAAGIHFKDSTGTCPDGC
jgi:hypothetical protein